MSHENKQTTSQLIDPNWLITAPDHSFKHLAPRMECHNLEGGGSYSFNVFDTKPLEVHDGTALIAVLDVGGSAVQIYDRTDIAGNLDSATAKKSGRPMVGLGLASGDQDLFALPSGWDELEINEPRRQHAVLDIDNKPHTIGRDQDDAVALGLEDKQVSRQHLDLQLSPDGTLTVTDHSTNGTRVITTAPEKSATPKGNRKLHKWLGGNASRTAQAQ